MTSKTLINLILLLGCTLNLCDSSLYAEEYSSSNVAKNDIKNTHVVKTKFLRVSRDSHQQSLSLDTAIVRYQSEDGTIVDLVAAVHIADASYYEQLNNLFKSYDAVLYELVAPKGTRIEFDRNKNRQSDHLLGKVQLRLKSLLELTFQLIQINYTPDNFLHADMTPEQFSTSMDERGESFAQLFIKMMIQSAIMQNGKSQTSEIQMLIALFSENRALHLKKILALQFEDMGTSMLALEGSKGTTLISERNKAALNVFAEQKIKGKSRFAIFYGAGHMLDFEQKLLADFSMKKVDQKWLTAWNLKK